MTVAALGTLSAKALQHGPARSSADQDDWRGETSFICQTSFGLLVLPPEMGAGVDETQVLTHRVAGSDARTRTSSSSSGSAKRCVQHSALAPCLAGSAGTRGVCPGAAPGDTHAVSGVSGSSTSASHAESLESKLKEPSGSVAGAAACCGATIFSTGIRGSDAKADRRHRQPAVEIPHDSGRDGRGTSRKR